MARETLLRNDLLADCVRRSSSLRRAKADGIRFELITGFPILAFSRTWRCFFTSYDFSESTNCGGYEIRTHDGFPHTRFPSERTRPLCEPSNNFGIIAGKNKKKSLNFKSH